MSDDVHVGPRPEDFDRMSAPEFDAYVRQIGFDARIKAALAEPISTVGDVMTPEVLARIRATRDAAWVQWEAEDRAAGLAMSWYFCVRCHRRHMDWSAIGQRHAVPQPSPFVPVDRE